MVTPRQTILGDQGKGEYFANYKIKKLTFTCDASNKSSEFSSIFY